MQTLSPPQFQPGGTLRKGSVYIERSADKELPAALLRGEFCYVLAPRQIGKSSLRARVSTSLRQTGIRCAALDLTRIGGSHSTEEEFYFALIQDLARALQLSSDPVAFFQGERSPFPNRFSRFIRTVVLSEIQDPIVVFLDEIDASLSLPFSIDELFAAIRELYNARADEPICTRISFCLLGVCTPGELVQDPSRTPFNIGRAIHLEDFSAEEAQGFLVALAPRCVDPQETLDEVMRYTQGHPYMTQKLCAAFCERATSTKVNHTSVADLVGELFLCRGRDEDPSLEYAERRILADPRATELLSLYRRIIQQGGVASRPGDPLQAALRLSGLVAQRQKGGTFFLLVRNPIFSTVFSVSWLRDKERSRYLTDALDRWLASGRSEDLLLRGTALEEAQRWAEGQNDLQKEESEFLLAGLLLLRKQEILQQMAEATRRRARILFLSVLVLVPITLSLLVLYRRAILAEQQSAKMRLVAERAAAKEKGARAALLAEDPGHELYAMRLGLEAIHESQRLGDDPPPDAAQGVIRSLVRHRGQVVLSGHTEAVMAAVFSPDGTTIASASQDHTARLFRKDGSDIATLRGHRGWLWDLAFSPDGRKLVTASQDQTARIWQVSPPQELAVLHGASDTV